MFKVILVIIFCICLYEAGKMQGKKETLERVRRYIKTSVNWDKFMEKISV